MTRYSPSRNYLWAAVSALALALISCWFASRWLPAAIPATLLAMTSLILFVLALRPAIEIHADALLLGSLRIPWSEIQRVDRTSWVSPMVLFLTLSEGNRVIVVYPGDLDSANSLLRHIRRFSREALIDGVPYRQFWGDEAPAIERRSLPSPKYHLLSPEDESEVERLYQRLKAVGHLDPKNSPDEK